MANSNQSSKLREHLRKRDRGLGDRANTFWKNSRDIQDRQTRPDANKAGYQHVIQVENNIWRLLTESKKGKEFIPLEWFLLSCAACSHDFDKGLKSARPEGAHGVASGRFVHKHRDKLGVDATEAIAIDYLNSIHDYRGTQFVEELEQLPEKHGTQDGPIDLRRLAVVLKVGDTLQTDQTRVSDIAVDVEKLTPLARSKHLGRAAISAWHIEGSKVILEAYPESPEQRQSVQTAFELLREDEWSAISRELRACDEITISSHLFRLGRMV